MDALIQMSAQKVEILCSFILHREISEAISNPAALGQDFDDYDLVTCQ
jgi:hypothetical protein